MQGGDLHFPKIYDVKLDFSESGFCTMYIVMEYFNNTLASFLKTRKGNNLD